MGQHALWWNEVAVMCTITTTQVAVMCTITTTTQVFIGFGPVQMLAFAADEGGNISFA